jgi:hypothetical protein
MKLMTKTARLTNEYVVQKCLYLLGRSCNPIASRRGILQCSYDYLKVSHLKVLQLLRRHHRRYRLQHGRRGGGCKGPHSRNGQASATQASQALADGILRRSGVVRKKRLSLGSPRLDRGSGEGDNEVRATVHAACQKLRHNTPHVRIEGEGIQHGNTACLSYVCCRSRLHAVLAFGLCFLLLLVKHLRFHRFR